MMFCFHADHDSRHESPLNVILWIFAIGNFGGVDVCCPCYESDLFLFLVWGVDPIMITCSRDY
jgi:hypothetical protein